MAEKQDDKVVPSEENYSYPNDQKNLVAERERQARLGPQPVGGRSFAAAGNETDDYLGVSPEYMNYANETDRPYRSPEDSPAAVAEAAAYYTQSGEQPVVEEEADDEPAEDEKADVSKPKAQITSTTHEASRAQAPQGKPTK